MTESKMNYEASITHFWSLKALIVSFLLQLLFALCFDPHRCDHSPTCNRRTKHC